MIRQEFIVFLFMKSQWLGDEKQLTLGVLDPSMAFIAEAVIWTVASLFRPARSICPVCSSTERAGSLISTRGASGYRNFFGAIGLSIDSYDLYQHGDNSWSYLHLNSPVWFKVEFLYWATQKVRNKKSGSIVAVFFVLLFGAQNLSDSRFEPACIYCRNLEDSDGGSLSK